MVAWSFSAVVTGGLMSVWALGSADQVSAAASVLGTVVGLLGVLAVWAWRGKPHHKSSDTGQIAETAQTLARVVRRQWEDEAILRQLFEPAPLPVSWTLSRRGELMDCSTRGDTAILCHTHAPDQLIETFHRATRQRMVVLGPGGSGKTTFAVLLLLALLRTRDCDDPVPVLCPLSSFDPSRESARDWLQRRITEDYPALSDVRRYGTSSIVELLTEHRLVPVLDGLDEVPVARQAAVLAALNDTLPTSAPLVLTCRTDDFARAVRESRPLGNAAVLEPAPLHVGEALAALRLAAPTQRRPAWDALADHLAQTPESPVGHVLTSPLMATLVRCVYGGGDHDPTELADLRRFPTLPAVEHHLLDALIPTLYARSRRQDPTRGWNPEKARRHLTFLAQGLSKHGSFDFAWWKLHTWSSALTKPWRRAATWLAITLVGHLVTNPLLVPLFGMPLKIVPMCMAQAAAVVPVFLLSSRGSRSLARTGHRTGFSALVALSGGLAATPATVPFLPGTSMAPKFLEATAFVGVCLWLVLLTAGLPAPPELPNRGRPGMVQWRRRLARALGSVAGVAVSSALFFASYAAYVHNDGEPRFLASLRDGLVIGAVLGIGLAFFRWVRSSPAVDDQETVEETLRADRLLALLGGGACAFLFVLPDAGVRTSIWFASTVTDLAIVTAFRLLDIGVIGFVLALATCAWPYYVIARIQFAIRGQLPWQLQAFLADAHRLGILRRVNSTYQFRHARLQTRLAESTRLPEPRTPADGLPGAHSDSTTSP
ncbi:NACHT domain-containing protein [Streptomyces sp. NPDC005728]|uniref:NACHT domain-containing protein n=1 Tax=Streptomyces sp. NPDC005728 TaxID=3157054 RepID=UPI0033E14AA5